VAVVATDPRLKIGPAGCRISGHHCPEIARSADLFDQNNPSWKSRGGLAGRPNCGVKPILFVASDQRSKGGEASWF